VCAPAGQPVLQRLNSLRKRARGLCGGGLQTASGDSRTNDGALKCAATLRSCTAGSQDESRSRAIHNSEVKGAQPALAATLRCGAAASQNESPRRAIHKVKTSAYVHFSAGCKATSPRGV
jgi:hypothetical protein